MNLTNHRDRLAGYRSALSNAGITVRNEWIIDDLTLWNDEGGAEGMHRLLAAAEIPTAAIICSDFLVEGVYNTVRQLGYSIPDDISLISFDDFPMATRLDPPLTCCRQPLIEMGAMAADRLLDLIAEPQTRSVAERTLVRMPFIVRKSTRAVTREAGDRDEGPRSE